MAAGAPNDVSDHSSGPRLRPNPSSATASSSSTLDLSTRRATPDRRRDRKTAPSAIHDRWPDLTIILDLPVEKAMSRIIARKIESSSESASITSRCEKIPRQAAADHRTTDSLPPIDPQDVVHADIWMENQ